MDVHETRDARDFLRRAEAVLMRDEARQNLILGLAGTLVDHPEVYPEYGLWIVESAGSIVAAALRTPPFNLVLAEPLADDAIEALAVHLEPIALPGVVANRPYAQEFASRWVAASGASQVHRMSQGVYALREVRDVPAAAGRARPATEVDRPLLMQWLRAFAEEALPEGRWDERRAGQTLDRQLSGTEETQIWMWEEGEPVSITGVGGSTPNGVRIGPVYTPPEHRGQGYATSLVAHLSARQLERGRRFCFLYTDLANPTSNAIYERIGYERVCEADDIGFVPRSP
jgi:predicted GNAT family acetyltransferase